LTCRLLRSANWRRAPASENQKAFVAKRRGIVEDEVNRSLDKLTKGEAANIITRLKHGAKKRYEKKARDEKKAVKKLMKESRLGMKEIVQVGPLYREVPPHDM